MPKKYTEEYISEDKEYGFPSFRVSLIDGKLSFGESFNVTLWLSPRQLQDLKDLLRSNEK